MPEEKSQKPKKSDLGPVISEIRDWAIWIALALVSALVVGNVLNFVLGSTTPLVAVMSQSMSHDSTTAVVHYSYLESAGFPRATLDKFPLSGGFSKGDVLVVKGAGKDEIKVGDVIVFNAPAANYPIIHRVIGIQKDSQGRNYYRTKGDHNEAPDRWLIPSSEIRGKAIFKIPVIGFVKVVPMEICTGLGICKGLYG